MSRVDAAERIAQDVYASWARHPHRDTVLAALIAVARQTAAVEPDPRPGCVRLSDGQMQALRLAAAGLGNVEIAAALGVSPNAVKSKLVVVRERLGARNRVEMVVLVARAGLVTLGEAGR